MSIYYVRTQFHCSREKSAPPGTGPPTLKNGELKKHVCMSRKKTSRTNKTGHAIPRDTRCIDRRTYPMGEFGRHFAVELLSLTPPRRGAVRVQVTIFAGCRRSISMIRSTSQTNRPARHHTCYCSGLGHRRMGLTTRVGRRPVANDTAGIFSLVPFSAIPISSSRLAVACWPQPVVTSLEAFHCP